MKDREQPDVIARQGASAFTAWAPARTRAGAGVSRPPVLRESVEALGSLASGALSSSTARRVGQATSGRAAWRWSAVAILALASAAAMSV